MIVSSRLMISSTPLGPGADNVVFTWTSGASNVLGLTASWNNPAQTEYIITGTPAMNVTQTTIL